MAGKPKKAKGPVGHYVREWRIRRDLSLEKLAELIGKHHSFISRIEHGGDVSLKNFANIAYALGVSTFDLQHRAPDEPDTIFSHWETLTPADRETLSEMARVLSRKQAA